MLSVSAFEQTSKLISPVPSNAVPLIRRAVCNLVADAALPVVLWFSVGIRAVGIVPVLMLDPSIAVVAITMFAEPSNEVDVPVTAPEIAIVLAVFSFRAVADAPTSALFTAWTNAVVANCVVLVVIVFFAVFLTFVGNGSKWILEKVEFYKQVEQTTVATTAVPTAATETTAAESDSETEASEDATETEATTTTSEETSSTAG